jgi:hypothetical protein
MNALYALMACVDHGLVAVELIEMLHHGLVLTIGMLFLPSSMVLLSFPLLHVNDTVCGGSAYLRNN